MEMALLATYESLGSYRHLYTDLDQAAINHPWRNSSQKKIILGGICCRLIVGPTPSRNVGINVAGPRIWLVNGPRLRPPVIRWEEERVPTLPCWPGQARHAKSQLCTAPD